MEYLALIIIVLAAVVCGAPVKSGQGWLLPVSCYDKDGNPVKCDDFPTLELMPAYETRAKLEGDYTTKGDPGTVWRYYDDIALPGEVQPGNTQPGNSPPGFPVVPGDIGGTIVPFGMENQPLKRKKRSPNEEDQAESNAAEKPQPPARRPCRVHRNRFNGRIMCT